MDVTDLEAELAKYIEALSESAISTHRAEDRPQYEKHLAEAARMFGALRRDPTLHQLKSIVAQERHNYGSSYLSDEPGSKAEAAFDSFATLVERQPSAV
jgi:hypothetical protein